MKTTFDVLEKMFKVVNVAAVRATINGKVYSRKRPLDSQAQDVVLTALAIRNDIGAVTQPGVYFVNCYAKNYNDGRPDVTKLKQIAGAVITVLEAYSDTSNFFRHVIISENIMEDSDNPLMSYDSLRVNYHIEGDIS